MTIDEQVAFLLQSIASHDRQIGELTDAVGKLHDSVSALTRIAEINQRRISHIEGQEQ